MYIYTHTYLYIYTYIYDRSIFSRARITVPKCAATKSYKGYNPAHYIPCATLKLLPTLLPPYLSYFFFSSPFLTLILTNPLHILFLSFSHTLPSQKIYISKWKNVKCPLFSKCKIKKNKNIQNIFI